MRASALILATLFAASLLAAGHDLMPAPLNANQIWPVVTGNGSGFTAAWDERAQGRPIDAIVSSVVNANGEAVDGGSAAVDQKLVASIAIAHSPSDALVAWNGGDGNLFAERLSPSGMPLSKTLLAFGKDYRGDVAVAWNGSRYFVVWSTAAQLVGAFVAADGSSTTPQAFFIEPAETGRGPEELALKPDIAWDGQHFLVVFSEVPNRICTTLCPQPDPDRFRVMRLTADGDTIDSSPAVITGSHLRARVASSGAESLIALDSRGKVSTIVAHTEGGLTLDAETPIFQWFSDVASAVVWDGATFNLGWTYSGADVSWIGLARVTRSGQPFDYRVAATRTIAPASWGSPSMAVNDAGAIAFVVSEATGPSQLARARIYLSSEFGPVPAAPPPPANVVSYFGGMTARIDWQSQPAAGFVIEGSGDFGKNWSFVEALPGAARSATFYAAIGNLFRVRTLGPGGLSDGTVTSIGSTFRSRAARR